MHAVLYGCKHSIKQTAQFGGVLHGVTAIWRNAFVSGLHADSFVGLYHGNTIYHFRPLLL